MVLTSQSPLYQHLGQNLALLAISLLSLPVSTTILLLCYSLHPLFFLRRHMSLNAIPQILRETEFHDSLQFLPRRFRRKQALPQHNTILVTGLSMNKALTLTRAFHRSGHRVVGADFFPLCMGRTSNSVYRFYTLPPPTAREGNAHYISALLQIVQKEKVNLWVSCSGVASEVDDGMARDVIVRRTRCKVVQFGASLTAQLHEKDRFMELCKRLGLGAAIPETYNVTSRDKIHRLLSKSQSQPPSPQHLEVKHQTRTGAGNQGAETGRSKKKHYILKSVGVDDSTRSDMTLLPRRTASQTYDHVATLPISEQQPFILQQYVAGKEYCTHSVVVGGEVKAFVACPSSDMLMHYRALPSSDPLSKAMLAFTKTFAGKLQAQARDEGDEEITGHLSFDFLISTDLNPDGSGGAWSIKCIECNPRPHTAVGLFTDPHSLTSAYLSSLESRPADKASRLINGHALAPIDPEIKMLAHRAATDPQLKSLMNVVASGDASSVQLEELQGYIDELDASSSPEGEGEDMVLQPLPATRPIYWAAHDIPTLFFLPLSQLLLSPSAERLQAFRASVHELLEHVLLWQEGTFEVADPAPAWWGVHVFWPAKLGACVWDLLVRGRGKWSRINVSTGKMFGC